MKRSEINRIIAGSISFFDEHRFSLPPFCRLKPDEWRRRALEFSEIIGAGLGWDVTDFNLGQFEKTGILLVTIRNGGTDIAKATGRTYCEKIIHMRQNQNCPMHYHKAKTEDIINRGGGTLCFELYVAGTDGRSYSRDGFTLFRDGIKQDCRPGEVCRLSPGESLTLTPYLYHRFWAEGQGVLVGEVSTVNDDVVDNFFYQDMPRFMGIQEDEEADYLLVHEVAQLIQ
jgi:hypothetical protein